MNPNLTTAVRSLTFITIAAQELAHKVTARVRERADAKDVDLVPNCTCGHLLVEPNAFSEVLYELLDNAIRASRRGHPVFMDVRNGREGDVLWQIQDTGAGMSEQTLARVREPRPREARAEVGLDRAWSGIRDHGGLLRFESALGVGTTASIWLPPLRI